MYKAIFIFILLLVSCKEQVTEPVQIGTINGKIAAPMDATLGLPNVKLYLIDLDIKIDTVNYKNEKAILDSTMTNEKGEFVFNIFKAGRYLVHPIKNDKFTFDLENPNLSPIIDIKKDETKTINFISNLNVSSSTDFILEISLKNFKWDASYDLNSIKKGAWLIIYRRTWYAFVPLMKSEFTQDPKEVIKETDDSFTVIYRHHIPKAFTFLVYSIDNYFSIDLYNNISKRLTVELFQFYLPFIINFSTGNEKVNVTYDMLTKKTEIKY